MGVPAEPKAFVPLLPYQREDVECEARFRWCCWSRQTGKSFTKSLRRILRGLKRGRTQIFLSAGERQARELMDKARQHCQALKIGFDYYEKSFFADTSFKQLEIHLPRGVRIIGLPANPQTARGFTGDVFLDEFAMHADDRQIWSAMFPALLRGQGELDVASTPAGCKNVFHDLRENETFSHSTITLPQAISQGLDVDLDEVRRSMGDEELFRQEFLCEFLDEATALLTYEQISACEDPRLRTNVSVDELATLDTDLYLGVDVARRRDLTVVWVLSVEGGDYVTRGLWTLANAPFREQQALLRDLLRLRHVRRCCMDAGGLGMQLAEAAVDEFGAHRVEGVTFTNPVKTQLAGALRIAVENGRIRIPIDEALRNDWHSLERSVTSGGHIRFDARRQQGTHADRFWGAALAVHATGASGGRFEAKLIRPSAFSRRGGW